MPAALRRCVPAFSTWRPSDEPRSIARVGRLASACGGTFGGDLAVATAARGWAAGAVTTTLPTSLARVVSARRDALAKEVVMRPTDTPGRKEGRKEGGPPRFHFSGAKHQHARRGKTRRSSPSQPLPLRLRQRRRGAAGCHRAVVADRSRHEAQRRSCTRCGYCVSPGEGLASEGTAKPSGVSSRPRSPRKRRQAHQQSRRTSSSPRVQDKQRRHPARGPGTSGQAAGSKPARGAGSLARWRLSCRRGNATRPSHQGSQSALAHHD